MIGNKQKKKLAIEPVEAETVIRAFDLAKNGDGSSGPAGNEENHGMAKPARLSLEDGSLFGTGTIHEILTRRAYTGVRHFNEFARKGDGERKAQSEIVEYEIPAIIDQATFEAVQALLVSRHPRSSICTSRLLTRSLTTDPARRNLRAAAESWLHQQKHKSPELIE